MSTVTWLHISDWHQGSPGTDREKVLSALLDDVEQRERDIHPNLRTIDFTIFSGDVAWSGIESQYDLATKNLIHPLMEACGWAPTEPDRVFCVPGNHDIDWPALKQVPSDWAAAILDAKDYEECSKGVKAAFSPIRRGAFLGPLQNYLDFVSKKLVYSSSEAKDTDRFWTTHLINANGSKVAILLINSTWLSGRNLNSKEKVDDYGKLFVGESQLDQAIKSLKNSKAEISIAVMHHPLHWLNEADRNRVQELLVKNCDFILHGHEHRPGIHVTESILGDVITVPAGATWDRRYSSDPRYVSGYNLVHIDLDNREGCIFLREWNDEQHRWDEDDGLWPQGRYHFSLPPRDAERSIEARDAGRRVKHRFLRALGRRFLDNMEIEVRHTLERHGDIEVIKEVARFKILVRPGKNETLCIREDKNEKILKMKKDGKLKVEPCEFHYFRVGGNQIKPQPIKGKDKNKYVVHVCKLEYTEQKIEFERTMRYPNHGSSRFVTGRFCNRFKLTFVRTDDVEYEFHSLGGFPPLKPALNPVLRTEEILVEDLCFSDQGYLIQWFPKGV